MHDIATSLISVFHFKSMENRKPILNALLLPATALILLLIFLWLYRALGLPPSDQIVQLSEHYFTKYGYAIVFVGAFFEATPVLNFYLPGSSVVILGVAFSRDGTMNVGGVLATASVAFLMSYLLDYAAGYYGWHHLMVRCGLGPALERSRSRMTEQGWRWLWTSYVHPNIGALTATTCGILRLPLRSFIMHSAIALIFWNTLWGAIAYWGAEQILRFLDMRWLIPVIAAWLMFTLLKTLRANKKRADEHNS